MSADAVTGSVLILGGTSEANALAVRLGSTQPRIALTLSLAGRTKTPRLPPGVALRTGGFGGADGLARHLASERIALLVDATHPYAARITSNAAAAAAIAGCPLAVLSRPPWPVRPDWRMVRDEAEACAALPPGARPFVALGSRHLTAFGARTDIAPVLRMIEPPMAPASATSRIVLERPGNSTDEELAIFRRLAVTHLVCRNAGGTRSHAKVDAAGRLGLPIVMIARPPATIAAPSFDDIDALCRWIADTLAAREGQGA